MVPPIEHVVQVYRRTVQRRLRDAHALTQHFVMKADTYTKVGAVLARQDVDLALF